MGNVIDFSEKGECLKSYAAYTDGQKAARDCYIADLQQRMVAAWLAGHNYVMVSYHCPPEDPLHRLMLSKDYRRGLTDALRKEFGKSVFLEGPHPSDFFRVAVCRSRMSIWFLGLLMWMQSKHGAKKLTVNAHGRM